VTVPLATLAALLVVAALAVERARVLRQHRGEVGELATQLRDHLRRGDAEAAARLIATSESFEASVLTAGLLEAPRGASAAREAMAGATVLLRLRLEARLGLLGSVGFGAPLVGVLGAELGVRHALAVGLAVGLLALAAWTYFLSRARVVIAQATALGHVLVSYLVAPPRRAPERESDAGRVVVFGSEIEAS
jgi:biopolymer transport protein ExbB/TolQ